MYFAVLKKRKLKIAGLISILLVISLLFTGGIVNVVSQKNNKKLPVYRVDRKDNKIAISFDCAWGVDYTDKLLSIMKEEDVKCTFFMVEFWTKKNGEYVKKISDSGHEIGTHSATHPYMSKLDKTAMKRELTTSVKAIEDITHKKVKVFRPPYGDYNDLLIETAEELNLHTIQWSVDSLDWKNLSKEEIEKRVVGKVKSGSIVLFHNQGLHTHEALKSIIKKLKEKGYEFVTIGELIYTENYKVMPDGTQVKDK